MLNKNDASDFKHASLVAYTPLLQALMKGFHHCGDEKDAV
jgi:hypothetical protein